MSAEGTNPNSSTNNSEELFIHGSVLETTTEGLKTTRRESRREVRREGGRGEGG